MNQPPTANQPPRGPARPGAMTMAMQAVQIAPKGPKVLRIGQIQGGKIIEERIVRQRETVTVGPSERNHFILQAPDLPPRFELFQLVGNDYILNFTASMRGRVGLPGGVQDLDQLRSSGGARREANFWQIKLNDNSRGKVVIGDVTLLFQFVQPPPVQPRPQLPAAVVGGFVKSIDWLFTSFVVFTLMFFFGFVIYMESADWPIEQGIAAIPEDMMEMVFEELTPPPPDEDETPTPEKAADAPPAEKAPPSSETRPSHGAPTKQTPGPTAEERAQAQAEAAARIGAEASRQAQALILGAFSSGGGDLADTLAGGAVTGNAAEILDQASGVGVAMSGSGQLRSRSGGGGSGQGGSLGALAAAGGPATTTRQGEGGAVEERVIRGSVRMERLDETGGEGTFAAAAVVGLIRQRQGAIRACYERFLRQNPTLQGRVAVEFTIQGSGSVTGATASENTTGDAALASCVVNVIRGLRWNPGPADGSVSFSYPFIFAPQN